MNKKTLSICLAWAMLVIASSSLMLWTFKDLGYMCEALNALFRFLFACYVLVMLWKN